MKRLIFVLVVLAFVLSACAPAAPAADFQNGKPIRFLSHNATHPVVRTMMLGFLDACKDLGVQCVDGTFEGVDFSKLAPQVDIAIDQGSSGVIRTTNDVTAEQDTRLIAAGIPVCGIHVEVSKETHPGYLCWVATDAQDYARRAADALGKEMGGKGTVAITQGDANDLENNVAKTFKEEMNLKYPEIIVLEPQMEGFDPPAAIATISALLQAHPEITGAFGTTGNSPSNWATASQQAGNQAGDIKIIGMDYLRANLDAVKSGWVYALVGQPLYEETYRAVELLVANMKGEKVEYGNYFPAPIITIENIDTYYGYADRVDEMNK
jgi:ribose transport system substrate-binding protein